MTRGSQRRPGGSRDAANRQFGTRHRIGGAVIFSVMVIVAVWLLIVQTVQASNISAEAASQRTVVETLSAKRGSIEDRNGKPLAYTEDARSLTFQPKAERKAIEEANKKDSSAPKLDDRLKEIAQGINQTLGEEYGAEADEQKILDKLKSNQDFVYLVRNVSPDKASVITDKYTEVGAERSDIRLYPGGPLAANLVGDVNFDGDGLLGLESAMQAQLAGVNGSRTYDRGSDGAIIPGSTRNVHPAQNGANVQLTIDADLQWYVQSEVQQAKERSGAKNAKAVVLDAKSGKVLAMANDNTFDPSRPLNDQQDAELGNPSVSTPFEPGSVNKLVAAAAAIEFGLTNPDQVLRVPGSIEMSGVTVNDWWPHGVLPITATGVFGKSSNVGTLMLAQRIGQQRYADMLKKFGLGTRTGVGLPGESGGIVPALQQWSGGTFANLPIGQGLSMSLLQMTSMYQAIANGGVRIPPRVVGSVTKSDGSVDTPDQPEGVRVVSEKTAETVRNMFRAVVQSDPTGLQQGTGVAAAVPGYQISGKTGTAQQVDPRCGCYSNSNYNITFAGIAPADDPRYVIGLFLDNPKRSTDGSGGETAAPLFENIASWMLQRNRVPLSSRPAPKLTLEAH